MPTTSRSATSKALGQLIVESPKAKPTDWRMRRRCTTCPFMDHGKGFQLRNSLHPGRWHEILRGLRDGEVFFCHKHTDKEQDDSDRYLPTATDRVCAGAIAFQESHGTTAQYVQVCERLDAMKKG